LPPSVLRWRCGRAPQDLIAVQRRRARCGPDFGPGLKIAIEAAIGAARHQIGETTMATIGAFTANADGSYSGAIRTLSLNVKTVQFRPVEKTGERSPDFRVYSGQTEFGAAWKKTSKDNNDYLSVKLDDPSFSEAMNAALVLIDGVHSLVWSRPSAAKDD